MSMTINIDIGGTFTDFFVSRGDGVAHITKAATTHYDLSVGFLKGLKDLAKMNGQDMNRFLNEADSVRYSTTIGTNALIERTGPKLGMITTAGFEDTLFLGRGRSWADGLSASENKDMARIKKPEPLICRDMIVGVRERTDSFGNIISPLNREEILEKLQILVDRGAMGFVVCLLWSFMNPDHERMIKEVIEEEYPEDFLGAMPVMLSSDISPKSAEYTRFTTTTVNAYIHGVMAEELNKLGIELRNSGYKKPLVLVHNTGGMKKVSRTRAILTHNAGPVAGLHGSLTMGREYEARDIIFTDMGGTSFDIGVITDGRLKTFDFIPVIDRWRTNIPAIEVKSIGAGGGSVAWINQLMDNSLEIGPQSAGSMPGPACYDQGGTVPTVTDADMVLGYLNPDNYLGGKMLLDPDLSHQAIKTHIADPLNIETVEAAIRIKKLVDARMGQEVFNEVALKGHDPRNFVLFACGGAGATHVCGFAPYLQVKKVIVPSYSSVFGAYGASTVNCQQVWEKSRSMKIFQWGTQSFSQDVDSFNEVVNELRDNAIRDLKLEGFEEDKIKLRLELDMRYGMQYNLTRIVSPHINVQSDRDFKEICDRFTEQYAKIYSPEATFPMGGINIECFFLTAYVKMDPPKIKTDTLGAKIPDQTAQVSTRSACWHLDSGFEATPVYAFDRLAAGNIVVGPALIEAQNTTYVIEPGWQFRLDAFHNAVLDRI